MIVYFQIISVDIIYNLGERKDFADEHSRNEFGVGGGGGKRK